MFDGEALWWFSGPHLQAGVEAPRLLVQLARCGVQPHKAVVAQDDGGSARKVVEVSLLSFNQRWRDLDKHSLPQLKMKRT